MPSYHSPYTFLSRSPPQYSLPVFSPKYQLLITGSLPSDLRELFYSIFKAIWLKDNPTSTTAHCVVVQVKLQSTYMTNSTEKNLEKQQQKLVHTYKKLLTEFML